MIPIEPKDFIKYRNVHGIYAVVNTKCPTGFCKIGKPYVGQAVNIYQRLQNHIGSLRSGHDGCNRHLLHAWRKYGQDAFVFVLLEEITDLQLITEREDYWINKLHSNENQFGYNKRKASDSNVGLLKNQYYVEQIKSCIIDFYNQHKRWPNLRDIGEIKCSDFASTWGAVDACLLKGFGGLPKGSSLAKFIASEFNVVNYTNCQDYSLDKILEWIEKYFDKYGKYPSSRAGVVEFAEEDGYLPTIKWSSISTALSAGHRGLEGGTSLYQFIQNHTKYNLYKKYNYKEACKIVREMKIDSRIDYKNVCKVDPRLPFNPYQFYARDGWKGWPEFVGRDSKHGINLRRENKYKTIQEASQATQRLSIFTSREYENRYKEDPKLPSHPRRVYSEWKGWSDFLGVTSVYKV